jgi:hypothetical protein
MTLLVQSPQTGSAAYPIRIKRTNNIAAATIATIIVTTRSLYISGAVCLSGVASDWFSVDFCLNRETCTDIIAL